MKNRGIQKLFYHWKKFSMQKKKFSVQIYCVIVFFHRFRNQVTNFAAKIFGLLKGTSFPLTFHILMVRFILQLHFFLISLFSHPRKITVYESFFSTCKSFIKKDNWSMIVFTTSRIFPVERFYCQVYCFNVGVAIFQTRCL